MDREVGEPSHGPPPTCFLCGRPLGRKIERHHPVPKSKGGRMTEPVHPICHRAIHNALTNKELATKAHTREALLGNEELARFVAWVANKPPDFTAPTRRRRH